MSISAEQPASGRRLIKDMSPCVVFVGSQHSIVNAGKAAIRHCCPGLEHSDRIVADLRIVVADTLAFILGEHQC